MCTEYLEQCPAPWLVTAGAEAQKQVFKLLLRRLELELESLVVLVEQHIWGESLY